MRTHDLMNDDTLDRFLALLAVWYNDAGQNITYADFPLDIFISSGETEVGAFHSSWDDNAVYLGFKGGTPNTNHAHMDIGSFVLDAEGERWAMDLGTGNNDLPGYYDRNGKRWNYYRTQNYSHNTLTMLDRLQAFDGFATIEEDYSDETYAYAKINMSELYPLVGKTTRAYEMKDRERVVITDRIEQGFEFLSVRWQMLTDADIELNESEALLRKNGKVMKVQINQPENAVFSILSTYPGDDKQRSNEGTEMLAIEYVLEDEIAATIAVEFIPNDSTLTLFTKDESLAFADNKVRTYPNPFTEQVAIDFSGMSGSNLECTIYDYAGRIVHSNLVNQASSSMWIWDGSNAAGEALPSGVYILKIKGSKETTVKKLIKK